MTDAIRPFHLAFPVRDLAEARAFYGGVLGCAEGRHSDRWIDFDLYGHQIVTHLDPAAERAGLAKPEIVEQDHDHIRRLRRRSHFESGWRRGLARVQFPAGRIGWVRDGQHLPIDRGARR